jgi:tetratricopeptide (TPR) repeat protein
MARWLALQLEDAVTNMSSPRRPARLARQFALALALASGTALLAVPGFADAAHAQKKKKGEEAEAAKPAYSKPFVDAYTPVNAAVTGPTPDIAALKPQMEALVPLAVSPDEQSALGGLFYNAGIAGKDSAMQLRGMEMMLASGKTKLEDVPKFNFVAFQIANSLEQFDKARGFLQKAIDLNYTAPNVTATELQLSMAELYFAEEKHVEGLAFLSDAIAARKAQGQPVDPRWYRRGVSVAYTNQVIPQVYDFVQGWVIDNPTPEVWRDAVNLTRNLNDFEGAVLLDLLRLGKKVGTLSDMNDVIAYIETADVRRLPKEVRDVIEMAYATGKIAPGADTYVDDQLRQSKSLMAEDKAALPALERDAKAATAQLRTVLAAGDAFLSYSEYPKAVEFYERALTMPGVDRELALTRLGIAQIGSGNTEGAKATLAQVKGVRGPVAMLWSAYAQTQADAAAGAAVSGE